MVDPDPGREGLHRLRGRREECAMLEDAITAVREGDSRTLVVRGEAGVGKSALVEHAVAAAAGLRVVRAVGVESEMELPFASLHQLCDPLLELLERLPAPQREALRVVFGLATGPPPDRFLIGLAVLNLLSEAAEERPLLCAIDDAQWLDQASAQTLGFVARRLRAEPVGLLFATREPVDDLRGLPELEVRGLSRDDARALLGSVLQVVLDERVLDRVVAETRGNPLALLELPRGLSAAQLGGGFGLLDGHALPSRIEESFRRRLAALPTATARLLLVAAAEPVGDPLLVWQAAERAGIEVATATIAGTEDLLTIGERVTFRHPLVRSAVYGAATPAERRAAHLALAEVTDRQVDPDRRAWHLAAAALGPDEAVAAELERSAGRARARAGLGAAAAFLRRSVALTAAPARRADRALAAAEASLQAGAFDVALGLLATARAGALDELQRARVDLLRAEAAYAQDRGSDAPALLLQAARTFEPLAPALARETHLDAWSAALFAGALAEDGGLHDVSRAARAAPQPAGAPRACDLLLDGLAQLLTDGRLAASPVLRQATVAFAGADAGTEEVLRWGWLATAAAVVTWDYDTCHAVAARGVRLAREAGALTVLAVGVNVLAQAVVLGGDLEQAALLVAEADAVTEATGTRVAPYGALVLAAHRGRDGEAFDMIATTIAEATAVGQGTAVQYARWSRAVILNALGRYDEAVDAAREAAQDTPELFVSRWALGELVEAAGRSGQHALAADALERLAGHVDDHDGDWARGCLARARALLAEGDAADAAYREAIAALGQTPLRPELARAHLLYGEWLRREGRRVEAREQLRAAHELLVAIGMEGFAERARRELLATGERVRRRSADTRDELTAQERQIAWLARDGLSNAEIGARLFLSPRTVEWHLHKVFNKLGISSRRALHDALQGRDRQATPA